MAFNYTPLKSTADKLIKNFGQSITFTRIATGTYNITSASTTSSNTYTANLAMLDEPKGFKGDTNVVQVKPNAVASCSQEILVGDTAVINSHNYRVEAVETIQPASTVVYYELQLTG